MSLIVARKEGNQLAIVSDTKLTYPNHEIKGQKENPSEGVIKTIILDNNLCVSFAHLGTCPHVPFSQVFREDKKHSLGF